MLKIKPITLAIIVMSVLLFSTVSFAGLITFETDPAGNVPTDDTELTSPYTMGDVQISFSFHPDANTTLNPIFEQIGDNGANGFLNDGTTKLGYDVAENGFEPTLGNFFLRQPKDFNDFGIFRIQYTYLNGAAASTAASGEIWDIDGGYWHNNVWFTEQYTVTAFDANGNLLQTLTSPLGDNYDNDGKPWVFNFTDLTGGIDHIDIDFTGTKTSGLGLAFNNFSATSTRSTVPIPAAVWLLGSGLLGLFGIRRRQRA